MRFEVLTGKATEVERSKEVEDFCMSNTGSQHQIWAEGKENENLRQLMHSEKGIWLVAESVSKDEELESWSRHDFSK